MVVGGAGYIGSHTCMRLSRMGHTPIVYDNFCNGHRSFVRWGPSEEGDIRDTARLNEVFESYRPDAIVHFAAFIEVGHSVAQPLDFFENNVAGSVNLLKAAARHGCRRIVFSSTCATYGKPHSARITEEHPQAPINPYGRSKLMVENILSDLVAVGSIDAVILRYFNAAGAACDDGIGERHNPETHAIPLAIAAAQGEIPHFTLFGDNYETPDGSCIRDYVHVLDLADAHVRAVEYLLNGGGMIALNLGSGTGTSVLELMDAVRIVSQKELSVMRSLPREGDPPVLVADASLALKVLGWQAKHDLHSIVSSAWQWHSGAGVLPRNWR